MSSSKKFDLQAMISRINQFIPDSSRASYEHLVRWYVDLNEIKSNKTKYARSILLAAECDRYNYDPIKTCGFEYHNYKPEYEPDFLIFCNAKNFSCKQSNIIPDWWHKVQRDCVSEHGMEIREPGLYLPCENWIEFDQNPLGLTMAGIWQMIREHHHENYSDWLDICLKIENWTFPPGSISKSESIANFYSFFGFASQIGIMSGRGSYIKLMKEQWSLEQLHKHCEYISTLQSHYHSYSFSKYFEFIKIHGNLLHPAINIDIDIAKDCVLPRFGVEFYPANFLGGDLPDYFKMFLLDVCHVDSRQISDLSAIVALLPKGVNVKNYDADEISRMNCTYVAKFDHVKVVFSPNELPKLKTYVRLVSQYGMQTYE